MVGQIVRKCTLLFKLIGGLTKKILQSSFSI